MTVSPVPVRGRSPVPVVPVPVVPVPVVPVPVVPVPAVSVPVVPDTMTAGSWASAASAAAMSPSVWRSTHSIRCISPSASRLTAWIAPSAARASAGWLSNTYSPKPACTVTTVMLCATTSCSSRAIRSRSRVTASVAARSRRCAT